eukprot:CAMPEP_0171451786 /NCGR_PEP_ID=MMETSP0945-20130129/148_1 /TAXON_ID=109269 /ORGANISM="Vaucheria litorea, Strain CCMP2940" /LENGTH=461 /DNA_ID=CAMNT_0011976309 /DNA_START=559 /DNA_END=1945 /DNA_ORIENTATION=+
MTRANVDVQPYAFTTKSLYVGHMDYRYLRWQVIDTPGVLDHPLEERNTIEMQAITALAHLQCCIIFLLDISEQCGYPISEQLSLFDSLKPLFANKQLLLVANKTDLQAWDELSEAVKKSVQDSAKGANVELMFMSNVSEDGVMAVKTAACDKLLTARVDARLAGKKVNEVMNRITVATPKPRDDIAREASIPDSVLFAKMNINVKDEIKNDVKKLTEKDIMWMEGGPGVYNCDYRKYYDLLNTEWKLDKMPEIMDGKNVYDFVDPDIENKLDILEREEEQLEEEHMTAKLDAEDVSDIDEETIELAKEIRKRKKMAILNHNVNRSKNKPRIPRNVVARRDRTISNISKKFSSLGVPTKKIEERGRKRARSMDLDQSDEGKEESSKKVRVRSVSVTKDRSNMGVRDGAMKLKARKLMIRHQKKFNRLGMRGEADRKYGPKLDKHLLAGKMGKAPEGPDSYLN